MTDDGDFPSFDPGPAPQRQAGRPTPPPRRPVPPDPQPNPWLVGMAIATVLAALSVISFGLLAPDGTAQAGTSSPTTAPTTGDTADDTTDTTPGDTTETTTGDTTGGTQSTLPGSSDAPTIAPVGVPIAINELTMSSNDIGPLEFGDPGNDVLGRLVSTFGQPTDDTGFIVGNGSFGECPGDSIRVVRWGPLNIVTRGEPSNHVFVSYRMDLSYGGITSPTTDMATLSGLRVGDTVGELESIYEDFNIQYVVDQDVGLTFELRASSGGDILLWGPVDSQAPDALVTGIYSPDPCDTASSDA